MKTIQIFILFVFTIQISAAQLMTSEDSLNAGLNPTSKNVILSGYGEAAYTYQQNSKTAQINLTRNVVFIGYKFNSKITLLTEIEIEDAKVDASGGEVAVEQFVLKFDLNRNNYIMAGLIIPRIGIMNENHLPTTYNGNNRYLVEKMVIPSTWRELGVAYYGNSNSIAGLNWSLGIMNGLNSAGIAGSTGIRDARYEGRDATAINLAMTGALLYYIGDFRLQLSGYYGGTVGVSPQEADTLGLTRGAFGTPVGLTEFNVQYVNKGLKIIGLATYISIPNAEQLNIAYSNNAAKSMYGFILEAGYNLLETSKWKNKSLIAFARYEALDLMASIPNNGIQNNQYKQQYFTAGLTYLPIRNIAIKANWVHQTTGQQNPELATPDAAPYQQTDNFYQLGIAYSF